MSAGTSRAGYPVWANGGLHGPGTPVVSAEDEGFLLGLSVFDSLLLESGCVYWVEEHLARLASGAHELAIPWPPPWDPHAALRAFAEAVDWCDCVLRITLTRGVPGRGATLVVTGRDIALPAPPGAVVHVSSLHKLAGDALETVKSTNRLRNVLAREEARAHGAWEALLLNNEGDLSEGTISNAWVVRDGVLVTPSTERGCLSGITRDRILAELEREPLRLPDGRAVPVTVGRVETDELARAEEVFLTNTSGRVVPVTRLGGLPGGERTLPGDAGPVAREVLARLLALDADYRTHNPRGQGL